MIAVYDSASEHDIYANMRIKWLPKLADLICENICKA